MRNDVTRSPHGLQRIPKFPQCPMRKRFGRCLFDAERRQLFRDGRPVHLSPKGFGLLALLLARAPNVVSKEEIQAALWPDTFVSDASLTNVVAEVRAAIGDRARDPAMVRTVHRFGYAFSGAADEQPDTRGSACALCCVEYGGRQLMLVAGRNVLGREPDVQVFIDHASVSRRHARIDVRTDGATLHDLQSRNGTFLSGRRIEAAAPLENGDVIGLGPATMQFLVLSATGSTRPIPTIE